MLIDTDQLSGPPAEAIVQSGSGALMLVAGSRGTGAFTALLLGSASRYAASYAPCPVVVVRDEAPGPYGLVGVGIGDLDNCRAGALIGLSARADLVVIGRHDRHPGLQGPGSVRHAVLNHPHGPVAVVPSS